VVVAALTVLFALFFMLPGDPARFIAGGRDRQVPPEEIARVTEEYHLDDPIPVQYVDYWRRILHGDFGTSYETDESVTDVMRETVPASLRLAFWAILVEALLGIGAGVLAAARKGSFLDASVTVSTIALAAVPVFLLGYLLQQLTGVYPNQHDWPDWARLPVQGIGPDSWALGVIPTGTQWKYLIQPAFVLALVSAAIVARVTRASMLETARSDYVRTARAKGLSHRQALRRHGMRNAMIPVVTLIGIDFGTLIGAAIITEYTFNWPGVGSRIASAVDSRDAPVLLGLSLVVVVAFVLVNLIVDLSYAWFDPRARVTPRSERVAS
jgi:ABC-type dipeptide/oligopeptide/nickel transport system permease component